MSAAARAEARRKAILSRGADRLSKLSTTARGEDNPVYVHDDPPLLPLGKTSVETFVGEETIMPTPPALNMPSSGFNAPHEGPTAWTPEQQQEFMRAFMQANMPQPSRQPPGQNGIPADLNARLTNGNGASQGPLDEDPMAAMMNALSKFSDVQQPGMGNPFTEEAIVASSKSTLEILTPLIHVVANWCLLAYFALFHEPKAYQEQSHIASHKNFWHRWSELSWRDGKDGFGVQTMPFFWSFITLQLALHSTRIFSKRGAVRLPTLLTLALPHLPSPIPSIIMNGASYLIIFSMLLNDIAALIVGMGLLIWISSMLAT